MANKITPPPLIPRNSPCLCSSDYNSGINPVTVKVGTDAVEDAYFSGIVYKKPGETYVGLDLGRYVKDAISIEEVRPQDNSLISQFFCRPYRVRMYNHLDANIFDFSGRIFAASLSADDMQRLYNGEKVGRFRIALQQDTTFNNSSQYDILLHNRIYTYNRLSEKLTTSRWNKAIVGAPVGISLFNATETDIDILAEVLYFNDNQIKTVAERQDLEFAEDKLFAFNSSYRLQQYTNYRYSAFVIRLTNLWGNVDRAVFIERVIPAFGNAYMVYYINSLGGIDWVVMLGRNYKRNISSRKTYQRPEVEYRSNQFQYGLDRHRTVQYSGESVETYELNTDIEREEEYQWLSELLVSPKVWVWDYQSKLLRAVTVKDNNFEYKNYRNNNIFNFKILLESDHPSTY